MSTLPTLQAEPAWAAFAAIDWGSQNHSWSVAPAAGGSIQTGKLDNIPEAVELWAAAFRRQFPEGPIAVALEQKRGGVIYMLSKYDHLILYPVPPSMSASYRHAFYPSGAKTDAGDAVLLLDLLRHHRDQLRPLWQDTAETRLLRFLVEQRRKLVQEKVRFLQQLTDAAVLPANPHLVRLVGHAPCRRASPTLARAAGFAARSSRHAEPLLHPTPPLP